MKKQIFTALMIASAVTLAGCSSSKKETEAPAPETPAAAEEAVSDAATETSESEDDWDILFGETEYDDWVYESEFDFDFWETESEYDFDYWETESEYDFFYDFDETETEAEVIPRPEYDVADYLTIEDDEYLHMTVQVPSVHQVTDEEIKSEISDSFYYLEDYDDLIVKKTEGTVASGDSVNIDYVGKKDGEAFEGGTAEGYDLVIGSGSFIEGFEDGLIGKEIGSTVDLNLTFPEEYGVEELNGAEVVFTVTINYVTEMPEITDEIAEKLSDGEYKTAEDYRESIRSMLQEDYDAEHDNEVINEIVAKLLDMYTVDRHPQDNVDYNVDMIIAQYFTPYASMYGMSVEEFVESAYGMSFEDMKEQQLEPTARDMVSQEIILGAIAEKEGITMTDEELQERLQEYADQYGVTVEDITAGQDMGYIRESELDQKVLSWLREKITVEEVSETEGADYTETEAETE